ncbi:MAG TPA: polysaccharide deacetylase family protein [Gemmatimonadaceae bacterium]|nr:polysaccharide deacetylase family protein [Gemmatimonadaceae bacterium]
MTELLITIHDVTPALAPRVQALWKLCESRGVNPGLLVVPDWHGETAIESDAQFIAWLRARAADGAEIFLHGERHDEVGSPRSLGDEVRAFGKTNKEGEFLTLDYDAARVRIDRGVSRLRAVGLEPVGFVPPAWLAKPATHDAVRDAGLHVSEDDGAIYVSSPRRIVKSPVVRWSGRGAVRAYGSVLFERLRWWFQRGEPVMRLALHPGDLAHPATAASIAIALDAWLSVRRQTFYRALS